MAGRQRGAWGRARGAGAVGACARAHGCAHRGGGGGRSRARSGPPAARWAPRSGGAAAAQPRRRSPGGSGGWARQHGLGGGGTTRRPPARSSAQRRGATHGCRRQPVGKQRGARSGAGWLAEPTVFVAAQVVRAELDLADDELLLVCEAHSVRNGGGEYAVRRGPVIVRRRQAGGQCSLGCRVGSWIATRSSLSMCSSVVLPALSRPRKRIFALLWYRPRYPKVLYSQSMRNIVSAGRNTRGCVGCWQFWPRLFLLSSNRSRWLESSLSQQ